MARKPDIDEEDMMLFRQAVADVRRLDHDQQHHAPLRPAPVPRQTEMAEQRVLQDMMSDEYEPMELGTGEELLFSRPGIQHSVMRKLKQGRYRIGAELDLHGLNIEAARLALAEFIELCRQENRRCVRIIHGKGLRSKHKGPVLKQMVNRWLQQRKDVLAFCSAIPRHGGTGAVYVLLRKI